MRLSKIDDFLFTPLNPKALALFRVLVALMAAFMFAPRNLKPIAPLSKFPDLSDFVLSENYYFLIYVLLIAFALGIKSQIIAIVLFIVLLPHDFLSEGRKSKQVILCVILCFSFLKSKPVWKKIDCQKKQYLNPIWPIRLIQIQLSLLYGVNAIAKTTWVYLSGETLIEMSKLYANLNVDLSDGYLNLLNIKIPVYFLAISSVLIEYFLAIGFWFKRTRLIALVVGIIFHLSLMLFMNIFMLDYISMFLYLAFLIPFTFKPQKD